MAGCQDLQQSPTLFAQNSLMLSLSKPAVQAPIARPQTPKLTSPLGPPVVAT